MFSSGISIGLCSGMWCSMVRNSFVFDMVNVLFIVILMMIGVLGVSRVMISRLSLVVLVVLVLFGLMKWLWIMICVSSLVMVMDVFVSSSVSICGMWFLISIS